MEKYNYDFIADQEPDGNSEWYPAKETDEKIEQYKHTLEHYTKEIKLLTAEIDKKDEENERLTDLNKAKGALIKAQAKKIGTVLKEKEWLINELIPVYVRDIPGIEKIEISKESLRDLINKLMKQALEEEGTGD